MPAIPYVPPSKGSTAFNCPHCHAYAKQLWGGLTSNGMLVGGMQTSFCDRCRKFAVWVDQAMVYPVHSTAPFANDDLPDDIRADYDEARSILGTSPRGAAALLRLSIQKLCKHLGEKGKDLNVDIGNLAAQGLPPRIQKALDVVRVIGNNAVHPGVIDLRDDPQTAMALFGLVNMIADVLISQPKQIEELYSGLPQGALDGIAKRDGGTP